jgi:hypothetical protein
MNIVTSILLFLVMLIIIFGAYTLCRKFIFGKVRINKWIPLSISIALFILQIFLNTVNQYAAVGVSIFAVLFFLWFMDINQPRGPKNKGKQIVIKPKAKPNRVKKNK